MTPLTPEEIKRMLSRPGVTPEDIDEYERLNAEHLNSRQGVAAALDTAVPAREARRAFLFTKLYGRNPEEPPDQ
jgi:hypothetical protein